MDSEITAAGVIDIHQKELRGYDSGALYDLRTGVGEAGAYLYVNGGIAS